MLRIVVESEPATLDSGEMTAKATLSPVVVLRRRAAAVAELFADPQPARVLCARDEALTVSFHVVRINEQSFI